MNVTLATIGIVCIVAAIAGGGLKAAGAEIPVITSRLRQLALGAVGVGLLVALVLVDAPTSSASSTACVTPCGVRRRPTAIRGLCASTSALAISFVCSGSIAVI